MKLVIGKAGVPAMMSLAAATLIVVAMKKTFDRDGGDELVPTLVIVDNETQTPRLAAPPSEPQAPREVHHVIQYCREADQSTVPELRRLARTSRNALVVGNAVRALGRLRALTGDDELMELLDDARPRVRQEMVRALGRSSDRSLVPRLAKIVEEGDRELSPLATQALGRLGGQEARECLTALLDNESTSATVRVFARAALKASRDGDARS